MGMLKKHRKMDRTLDAQVAVTQRMPTTTVTFFDAWGELEQTFCFAELDLPRDFAVALADAFRGHYTGLAPQTRTTVYKNLRYFSRWLVQDDQNMRLEQFDTAAFKRFVIWLGAYRTTSGERLSMRSRRTIATAIKMLVLWIQRHHPERLPARLDIPVLTEEVCSGQEAPEHVLPEQDLKAILQACYDEIKVAWARFELGQRVLRSDSDITDVDSHLVTLIRQLSASNNGTVPTRKALIAAGVSTNRLYGLGGVRRMAEYLHLTGDTLAPFFVALAIQTGANPEALRRIRRDCLVPHPLDDQRVIVEWNKPRAGTAIKRVQRRSFDTRRPHAAPGMIEKLLAMTARCAAQTKPQDQDNLFVVKAEGSKGIYTIPTGTLRSVIHRFIARSNQRIAFWNDAHPAKPTPYLPDFTLCMLRGSVANAHYVATGGNIQHVQKLLNHQHIATTEFYIGGEAAARLQQKTIARLQQLMVSWVMESESPPTRKNLEGAAHCFSHQCLNPFDPPGRPSPNGTTPEDLCPGFAGCLVCPGLVIPVDAEHLGRLLAAKARLEEARERLDPHRWQSLYGPTYQVITADILPDFPPDIYPEAQALLPMLPPLIELE